MHGRLYRRRGLPDARREKNKAEVDKYGREAMEKTISDAIGILH